MTEVGGMTTERPTVPGFFWVECYALRTGRPYAQIAKVYASKPGGEVDMVSIEGANEDLCFPGNIRYWSVEPVVMPEALLKSTDPTRVPKALAEARERARDAKGARSTWRWVLYSPKNGIFLGSCLGLGFWSKLDPVGQDAAPTFPESRTALDVAQGWDDCPKDIMSVEVRTLGEDRYATIAECVAAGLPEWTP